MNAREQRFVQQFIGKAAGNATKAAELAGYSKKSAGRLGTRLCAKPYIRDAIAALAAKATSATVATAQERRELLTTMARDSEMHPLVRLKAVDIANKMDGLYIQKHEISGKLTLEQVLDASR